MTLLEHVGLRCPPHPGGEGMPGAGWVQLWGEVQPEERPCAMLERLMDPGPRVTEFESLLHINGKIEVPPDLPTPPFPHLVLGCSTGLLSPSCKVLGN